MYPNLLALTFMNVEVCPLNNKSTVHRHCLNLYPSCSYQGRVNMGYRFKKDSLFMLSIPLVWAIV